MARNKQKRLIVSVVIISVVVLFIGTIIVLNTLKGKDETPDTQKEPATSSATDTNTPPASTTPKDTTPSPKETAPEEDAPDPATVSAITIEPMQLVVSYVKGAGGFSYEVNRTFDGRQFVEFSSEELAGTKCTNDTGVFASILESPNENEKQTVSKTTVIDGTTYGLAVASNTCTDDSEALKKYQDSFSAAFSLLKKAE